MSFGVSIGDVLKVCELATRVYKNCRDSPGEYRALTGEARSLTNILQDVADKVENQSIPENKQKALFDVYEASIKVLSELDQILNHYNTLDTKSKRTWDRLKWDPDRSRSLRDKLTSTVVMLNSFYTSLIHDNQVLILEALGRLEQDYKGGHREESLASVERITSGVANDEDEEDDDAAWSQIIRDLEDVGISPQDALNYREFITDWFVRAVNQGRLMEAQAERTEEPYFTMSRDFTDALSIHSTDIHPDISSIPVREINHSTNHVPRLRSTSQAMSSPSQLTPEEAISRDTNINAHNTAAIPDYQPLQTSRYSSIVPRGIPERTITDLQPYEQLDASSGETLRSTAQEIVQAWNNREFASAQILLESQLAAVERGETIVINGHIDQPERRLLRYLIGVCASFSGNFSKAKALFEESFNGIYLTGTNTDDGDIAAARWLGDACLQLNQPENAALAWAVALDGLIARYGIARDLTRRVYEELYFLNYRLEALTILSFTFSRCNTDPTDIFMNTHAVEKSNLVASIQQRMKLFTSTAQTAHWSSQGEVTKTNPKSYRPRTDWKLGETFLVQPLISPSAWPLQWDPIFSPFDAISLQRAMSSSLGDRTLVTEGFPYNNLPTIGLGQSKALHYVTKRRSPWLFHAVETGLQQLGIEYKVRGSTIMCRIPQTRESFAFFEGIAISFKKLQFRNTCGLKVSDVLFATRGLPPVSNAFLNIEIRKESVGFRNLVKDILEKAEQEERFKESAEPKSLKSPKSPSTPRFWMSEKRPLKQA
ncbi:hypothetical protein CC78DRAFT_175973 [Lojkania enalia]|uniref:Uncharacterized protein n=1 Tax=Lojkania enalia TaxID=147567 RepID=A0A9P4KDQ5_9PLEO|nr:hypothetical protein CC78DRAFT_175973 [Didymosphaeria enalia]